MKTIKDLENLTKDELWHIAVSFYPSPMSRKLIRTIDDLNKESLIALVIGLYARAKGPIYWHTHNFIFDEDTQLSDLK